MGNLPSKETSAATPIRNRHKKPKTDNPTGGFKPSRRRGREAIGPNDDDDDLLLPLLLDNCDCEGDADDGEEPGDVPIATRKGEQKEKKEQKEKVKKERVLKGSRMNRTIVSDGVVWYY